MTSRTLDVTWLGDGEREIRRFKNVVRHECEHGALVILQDEVDERGVWTGSHTLITLAPGTWLQAITVPDRMEDATVDSA